MQRLIGLIDPIKFLQLSANAFKVDFAQIIGNGDRNLILKRILLRDQSVILEIISDDNAVFRIDDPVFFYTLTVILGILKDHVS